MTTAPLRLLIVEDSEDDALLIVRDLKRAGYQLQHARVETAAAMQAELERDSWDVVVSDFNMPTFTGSEALRLLRERDLDTPFIFVSGTIGEDVAVDAMRAGAQDYVTKGNLRRLIPAIERELREAAGRRERRQLEQQFRQAQKMEAIGRLAGGVAHDFNNILTAIFGYADLALQDLPAASPVRDDLEEIRKAAERASALTRQLLAFSRQQVFEPTVVRLNDMLGEIDNMLARLLGEDVELRLSLSPETGNVRADLSQLQQVLLNLVVNARDAMPTGGKLLIETANEDLGADYAELHQPVVPGHYVLLAVTDTGTGMDAATRSRIFEPFYTTKERGRGTGLGLSTVYGIVKQSGGYIWVYSEIGHGTTFKIYLPRVDAPAGALPTVRERTIVGGTETILLAEDDDLLRPLGQEILRKLGYAVLVAANADHALAMAHQFEGTVHLLVTDVVMPGGSGRELARRLAQTRPDTRVLYISGYTDDAIVHHGMLEAGLHFLQKPFTPAVLARKVREVLDHQA